MAEYHQYCPVARASEILADRWTPLIVREMLAGSSHFNEIRRGLPGISRSLLVSRLRHLEDNGVVERKPSARSNFAEYGLTEAGASLKEVFDRLGAWGARWAFRDPAEDELNPELLMWKIHQRIAVQIHARGFRSVRIVVWQFHHAHVFVFSAQHAHAEIVSLADECDESINALKRDKPRIITVPHL